MKVETLKSLTLWKKSNESGNIKKLNAVKKKEEEKKNYCEKMFLTLLKRSIQTILRNLTVVKI